MLLICFASSSVDPLTSRSNVEIFKFYAIISQWPVLTIFVYQPLLSNQQEFIYPFKMFLCPRNKVRIIFEQCFVFLDVVSLLFSFVFKYIFINSILNGITNIYMAYVSIVHIGSIYLNNCAMGEKLNLYNWAEIMSICLSTHEYANAEKW